MPSINVLIIDDCPTSTAQLVQELASGGFAVTHRRADNAGAVSALLNSQDWNLVLSKGATGSGGQIVVRASD